VPAERVERVASQIDVLPTIAGICNIPYTNTTLGRDLRDTVRNYERQLAFIVDPDNQMTGIVDGSVYYRHNIRTLKGEFAAVGNNNHLPLVDSVYYLHLTEGIFETSKYLLLHNKKK
ncbi:MAG TPA: hypothetical protein VFZ47_05780, partial [Chitinophagaceae bacterium]